MIIQVRGTSGSGKSTAVRRFMEAFVAGSHASFDPVHVSGRKKPLYYKYGEEPNESVVVMGHYESACGGCDTIGSAREVFEAVQEVGFKARVVICEGLLLSEDTKWSLQMPGLRAIFLTTPLDTCLAQIKQRREAVGNDKELNPANTSNRVATIERARVKLVQAGVPCFRLSANQVPGILLRWIKEPWKTR